MSFSAEAFIKERLALEPLSFRPDIRLYRPTPRSGLTSWLAAQGHADQPPYWAYAWAGGAVLALHMQKHPELVAGRRVLDFGAGGGLVAIAAAKAGARVIAFEPDPMGQVAARLNAEANGVEVRLTEALADAEIVLAGDVFYDAAVAATTFPALTALAARGAKVLIGDPFRRDLPLEHLTLIDQHDVPDFGSERLVEAGVFALTAPLL
jgi:predicted nicotinamide N-methyase